ncbi:MAG: toxin-antitoxin system YwqK family antitoxin [Saprospiraceae bacterium]|nr:toxin-antitoxin system YwqK family antitoxin [Saprospiraceae bacterium]
MRFTIFFSFAILFFSACSNFETVETKDENGKLKEKFTINKKSKKKEGQYLSFYPNGQKLEESFYLNDSLQGEQKMYYENGQLESLTNHANGMFVGKYQKFDENGRLTNEGQFVNNEMSGVWKRWYDTGELQEEVTFAGNLENGPFKEYHKNGKLKTEGVYLDGDNENGELKIYDENGELTQKMYCEYGICAETWSKEKGEQTIDTVRIHNLAVMKKESPEIE